MSLTLAEMVTVGNFVFLIAMAIGGYIVIRSSIAKGEADVQTHVREALATENELLRNQVKRVEGEYKRLSRLVAVLIDALKKQRNITVEFDDDTVIIHDGGITRVAKLPDIPDGTV